MTTEKGEAMRGMMIRVKDKHRVMIKKLAAKKRMGEAEAVRDLIEKAFMKDL